MARTEQDREDLLREATALAERAELRLSGYAEPIVVGFRSNGCASFYFGADPVFQFNTCGELRRGYVAGKLLKAVAGRLVEMDRQRTADATILLSRTLTQGEQNRLLLDAEHLLQRLSEHLTRDEVDVVDQVPAEPSLLPRILSWLEDRPIRLTVAASPHAA